MLFRFKVPNPPNVRAALSEVLFDQADSAEANLPVIGFAIAGEVRVVLGDSFGRLNQQSFSKDSLFSSCCCDSCAF